MKRSSNVVMALNPAYATALRIKIDAKDPDHSTSGTVLFKQRSVF